MEWVYSNLMQKWSSVVRKGRAKLSGMFSGYGQNHKMIHDVLSALDKFLEEEHSRDSALDNIALWDQGDVHRVGIRYPVLDHYYFPHCKDPCSHGHFLIFALGGKPFPRSSISYGISPQQIGFAIKQEKC